MVVPHAVKDLARALRQEPTGTAPGAVRQRKVLTVLDVEDCDGDLKVTFRWRQLPYRLVHVLDPRDVLLQGGDLDVDEVSPEYWAAEAREHLDHIGSLDPMSTRRSAVGDAVEIVQHEPPDDRFHTSRRHLSEIAHDWSFLHEVDGPGRPGAAVAAARDDHSLVGWHLARLEHRYPLPYVGQVATRWSSPGGASVFSLEVAADMPQILPLVLASDAMQLAAARGARTVHADVEIPYLGLLGFREIDGRQTTDSRFLGVDHDGLADLAGKDEWAYPPAVNLAIEHASRQTYYAR